MIHELNAPSPAATAALSIGRHLAAMAQASESGPAPFQAQSCRNLVYPTGE